ncbi:hypothetical protein M885DRAFT_550955, partial [Pelagophyceae sp. CCMP2097]
GRTSGALPARAGEGGPVGPRTHRGGGLQLRGAGFRRGRARDEGTAAGSPDARGLGRQPGSPGARGLGRTMASHAPRRAWYREMRTAMRRQASGRR